MHSPLIQVYLLYKSLVGNLSLSFSGSLSFQIRTVKVSNVSLGASDQDLKEFFSFSGNIDYVEMRRLVCNKKKLALFLHFSYMCCAQLLKRWILE